MLAVVNSDDPRVQRTRRELSLSLLHLLKQQRLSEITVRELAERAGINRATFYAHFDDKFALVSYVASTYFQETLNTHLPSSGHLTRADLLQLAHIVFSFLVPYTSEECSPGAHRELRPLFESEIQKQLYRHFVVWLSSLSSEKNIVEVNATAMSWTLFGIGLQYHRTTSTQERERIAEYVAEFIAAGVEHTFGVQLL